MPLSDVFSREGTLAPAQIVALVPKENVGVRFGLITTSKLVGTAHWPAVGVKVYVPEFILSTTDGLQVPVIPLSEVAGKAGTVAPAQKLALVPKLKAGVMFGFTVTTKFTFTAH